MAFRGEFSIPQDLRIKYKDKPGYIRQILKTWWPCSGSELDFDDHEPGTAVTQGKRDAVQQASFELQGIAANTAGIDALLVLLKQLLSFDLRVVASGDTSRAVLEGAWGHLGLRPNADRHLKKELVKKILSIKAVSQKAWDDPSLKLEQLLRHPELQCMIMCNEDFQLYSPCFMRCAHGTDDWEMFSPSLDRLFGLQENLKWDGSISLNHFVRYAFHHKKSEDGRSIERPFSQPFLGNPRFIRINYEPQQDGLRQFADILTLKLDVDAFFNNGKWMEGIWETGEDVQIESQDRQFLLCAVVRLATVEAGATDGVRDDIRLYWSDGTEIVPQIVDKVDEKTSKGDARSNRRRWSIEHAGRYILFYREVWKCENLQLKEGAPEFEPRPWWPPPAAAKMNVASGAKTASAPPAGPRALGRSQEMPPKPTLSQQDGNNSIATGPRKPGVQAPNPQLKSNSQRKVPHGGNVSNLVYDDRQRRDAQQGFDRDGSSIFGNAEWSRDGGRGSDSYAPRNSRSSTEHHPSSRSQRRGRESKGRRSRSRSRSPLPRRSSGRSMSRDRNRPKSRGGCRSSSRDGTGYHNDDYSRDDRMIYHRDSRGARDKDTMEGRHGRR